MNAIVCNKIYLTALSQPALMCVSISKRNHYTILDCFSVIPMFTAWSPRERVFTRTHHNAQAPHEVCTQFHFSHMVNLAYLNNCHPQLWKYSYKLSKTPFHLVTSEDTLFIVSMRMYSRSKKLPKTWKWVSLSVDFSNLSNNEKDLHKHVVTTEIGTNKSKNHFYYKK